MHSFELNRLQSVTGISPVSNADRAKAKSASDTGAVGTGVSSADASAPSLAKAEGVAVEIASPIESGPPVDADRVAEIRNALRDGTYPLVPAKIADAMIAAQLKFEIQ